MAFSSSPIRMTRASRDRRRRQLEVLTGGWKIAADEWCCRLLDVIRPTRFRDLHARNLVTETLEARILFSASPVDPGMMADASEAELSVIQVQPDQRSDVEQQPHTAQVEDQRSSRHLVFVNSDTPDLDAVLDDLAVNRPGHDVFVLDAAEDGIDQISDVLFERTDIDSVHIISHGEDDAVRLGNLWLSDDNLEGYAGQIASWGSALSDQADILFYGCDLAASADGRSLVDSFAALTDADVAASNDDTGHTRFDADWDLEYTTGIIETSVAVSDSFQQSWQHKLATITVDTFVDEQIANGETSLREALAAAGDGDTIVLMVGTYNLTIDTLDIEDDITIVGTDARSTIIDASALSKRAFEITSNSDVSLSGLTIRGGDENNGGGILIDSGSTLELSDALLTQNSSDDGGAIHVHGELHANRVLFFDNTASGSGGAIHFHSGDPSTLTNVTISGNTAGSFGGGILAESDVTIVNSTITLNDANNGGGIRNQSATVSLSNTIVAGNASNGMNKDALGSFSSDGSNLVQVVATANGLDSDLTGVDPNLAALANHGGQTDTHAIAASSAASDAGTSVTAPDVDQRGYRRDTNAIDIGAFQLGWEAELWLSTDQDEGGPSGVSGQDTWDKSEILALGDPDLSFGPGTTDGTLSRRFDLNNFVDGGDGQLEGLHFVTRDITVGGANAIDLQQGDVLFATDNSTFNSGALSVGERDLVLFRPDTVGDYSSGTISIVLDDFATMNAMSITLIEQTTSFGDTILEAGDFLFSDLVAFGANNVYLFDTIDVGVGTTAGTTSKLIDGDDIGLGVATSWILGMDLVETETTIGGVTLSAGTLLLKSTGTQSNVGTSNLTTREDDIFALEVAETTMISGTAVANASMFLQASDIGMNSTAGSLDAFSLGFSSGNLPPTDITLSNDAVDENTDTSGGVILGNLGATDPDSGETFSFAIVGGGDQAHFSVDGSDQLVIDDGVLDFESQNSYEVQIQVTDSAGNQFTETISISVTDVNEAPAVSLTSVVSTLSEDADTSSAIVVANIVVDDDALGSETLSLSGVDASLFEIVGSTLRLRAGTTLDFETNDTLDVTVAVDDATVGGTPDDTAAYAVTVTDANEAPSVSLTSVVSTLSEDADTSSAIVVANIVVDDDALGSETLSLSGADAGLFEIVGSTLRLRAGTTLDFETNDTLDVTVAVDDTTVGGTPDDTVAYALTVTDANDDATGKPSISGDAIEGEILSAGVGTIADEDGVGVITYQWQRDGLDVSGAVTNSYDLTADDLGSRISVTASFIDGGFHGEGPLVSSPTAVVTAASVAPEPPQIIPPPPPPPPSPTTAPAESASPAAEETETGSESDSGSESASESGDESTTSDDVRAESAVSAPTPNPGHANTSGSEADRYELELTESNTRDENSGVDTATVVVTTSGIAGQDAGRSRGRTTVGNHSATGNVLDLLRFESVATLSAEEIALLSEPGELWDALDENQSMIESTIRGDLIVVGTAGAAASSITVGVVAWALRSGLLLSGLLAQLPAWRAVDPLLVMQGIAGKDSGESLEELMDRRNHSLDEGESTTTHDTQAGASS